ncbi:MAG: STAS domain-containing protein [Thermostichales cyanobacterium SZTDM-1c_bins_54]
MLVKEAISPKGSKIAILPFKGRIDSKVASEIRQLFQQLINKGYPNILVEMAEVTFLDSAGLGVLIAGMSKCRSAGGSLCLCQPSEAVQVVLNISATERILTVFPDQTTAVQQFPT